MATNRQYFIPGSGYVNETKGNDYFIPGWLYINETVSTPVPPSNNPYILGSSMIQQGTSILNQGTTPLLNKGTVRDPLNLIPH